MGDVTNVSQQLHIQFTVVLVHSSARILFDLGRKSANDANRGNGSISFRFSGWMRVCKCSNEL